jgi:formylglycine-generating enzyme required for sulfatase activity
MKTTMFAACLIGAASAFAGVATVSNVSVEQSAASRRVTIKYTLSAPAVVTVDIQTNRGDGVYASIGAENFATVWKDVNRRVTPATTGQNEIYWQPCKDWQGVKFDSANMVKAVVTAWAYDATPDYMAVSLTTESNVFYYVSEAAVPGGVKDNRYKTDWLLMRKIPAQGVTWRMGIAPADVPLDATANRAQAHLVQLSDDYYMCIYPVTQRQYSNISGWYRKGAPTGDNAGDMKPAGKIDWGGIRGGTWPGDSRHETVADAILKARQKTGIAFDLPTEAQWEFACRAGTGSCLYTGKEWNAENLDEIAWFSENTTHLQDVGQKRPNEWGLYDMIGNVSEMCLDYYAESLVEGKNAGKNGEPIIDPEGLTEPINNAKWSRAMRGGGYTDGYASCASHIHACLWANDGYCPENYGFRLMAPMGGKWE